MYSTVKSIQLLPVMHGQKITMEYILITGKSLAKAKGAIKQSIYILILFTVLCQFYIINTNNRYNNTHKNIPHTVLVSDKARYMLQPKPFAAALAS